MAQSPHDDAPRGPLHPPSPRHLRLLLRLTVLSFAANVVDSLLQSLAGPGTFLLPHGLPDRAELIAAVLVGDLVLTTALYALVWFPLRARLQWGWMLGLVLCSLAVLGGVFNLAVFALDGHLAPALSTVALVAVNVAWLAVAARAEVRAALR